ncbi:MAG: T9SS type A sorting domain-containing protein [Alphaproteobacteria bacterium]|nr:T9SS type A sorting domain-containing protein [Alphaproteobacteria bacterium]
MDDPGSLIRTYPVPVAEKLTVEAMVEHFDLAVFDHLGQMVLGVKDLPRKSSIDFGRIAAGLYILQFTRDGSVVTRKIIRL